MKKRPITLLILFLVITLITLCLLNNKEGNAAENSNISAATIAKNELFNEYYNNGTYQKNTVINLNETALDEIKECFHSNVTALERITYYKETELWMSNSNGYSGYGTMDGYLTQFKVSNNLVKGEETKTAIEGGMEGYYCTLYDFIDGKHLSAHVDHELDLNNGWEYVDGILCSTNKDILDGFRLFTAPLWLNNEDSKNYISFKLATLEEKDGALVMSLWAESTDEAKFAKNKTITVNAATYYLFSQAIVTYDKPTSSLSPIYNLKMESISNYDSVKRNTIGSIIGTPAIVEGKTGNALQLDGKSGITLDNVDLSDAFTLEFEFKRDEVPANYETLVAKCNYSAGREWGIYLTRVNASQMAIKLNVLSNTEGSSWKGVGGHVTTGEWHNVKVMASNELIWLFVDGNCYGSFPFVRQNNGNAITIGCTSTTSTRQFAYATIDEIKLSSGNDYKDNVSEKIATDGLALRYSFEKDTIFSIKDLVGNKDIAIKTELSEVAQADSKIASGVDGGFGLYLNGATKLTTGYTLNIKSDFTLSVYFKADKTDGIRMILGQADYSTTRDFSLYIEGGKLKVNTRTSDSKWSTSDLGTIETGTWYCVTITNDYEKSTNTSVLKTYINGVLKTTTTNSKVGYSGAISLNIGGSANTTNHQYFAGSIDELLIYTRILSDGEIQNNIADKIN